MRPITATGRQLLTENCAAQDIQLSVQPVSGAAFFVFPSHIKRDSLKINYASTSGDYLEVGTVIAPDLRVTLLNEDGIFDDIDLVEARMTVLLTAGSGNDVVSLNMGIFYIDEVNKDENTIDLKALGSIVELDQLWDPEIVNYPITVLDLASAIANRFGYPLHYNQSDLVNTYYSINAAPSANNITFRTMLGYCCEIMGCCALLEYVNDQYQQMISLRWYKESGVTLTSANRFSGKIEKTAVPVDVVRLEANGVSVQYPPNKSSGNVFIIKNNPLITVDGSFSTMWYCANLLSKLEKTVAYPFEAIVLPMPYVEPLDYLTWEESDGTQKKIAVTSITWGINSNNELCGRGYKNTESSFAEFIPFTDAQAEELSKLTKKEDLADVATSGDYNDLLNKPDLAPVATSGNYDDLSGAPDPEEYAVKDHTVLSGSLSLGRHAGSAVGYDSVAEGEGTIAGCNNQHATGRYNVEDLSGRFVSIVGNGQDNENRSNAHTLDWGGNAWYEGKVCADGGFELTDDETSDKYRLGIENGLLYIEEVN